MCPQQPQLQAQHPPSPFPSPGPRGVVYWMEQISPWDQPLKPQRHKAGRDHGMEINIFLLQNWELSGSPGEGFLYFASCFSFESKRMENAENPALSKTSADRK